MSNRFQRNFVLDKSMSKGSFEAPEGQFLQGFVALHFTR